MPKKTPAPYPDYVQRTLAQARLLLEEEDYSQPDAAALCFDLLALFPDLQEASDLVLTAFNDPELIRDQRKALGRMDPDFAADPEAFMQPLDHMPPDPDLLPADFAPPPVPKRPFLCQSHSQSAARLRFWPPGHA
jgi:hypothetical protein